jgi:hypothetical protein
VDSAVVGVQRGADLVGGWPAVGHCGGDDEFGQVVAEWCEGEVVEVDERRTVGRDDDVAEVAVLVQRGRQLGEPGVSVGEDVLAPGGEAPKGQTGGRGEVPAEVGGMQLAGVGGAVQPAEDRSDVFQVGGLDRPPVKVFENQVRGRPPVQVR